MRKKFANEEAHGRGVSTHFFAKTSLKRSLSFMQEKSNLHKPIGMTLGGVFNLIFLQWTLCAKIPKVPEKNAVENG